MIITRNLPSSDKIWWPIKVWKTEASSLKTRSRCMVTPPLNCQLPVRKISRTASKNYLMLNATQRSQESLTLIWKVSWRILEGKRSDRERRWTLRYLTNIVTPQIAWRSSCHKKSVGHRRPWISVRPQPSLATLNPRISVNYCQRQVELYPLPTPYSF